MAANPDFDPQRLCGKAWRTAPGKERRVTSTTIHARPQSGAAPFDLSECFFSRTDRRGVIAAGNAVFQRVSHYPWDKMIEAPHKLVRHPDMPRGLFEIMWAALRAGRPVGAYVKNLAQDGLHYWVFAIVTPVEDGFLSVRIKPTSAIFDQVAEVYEAVRAEETAEALAPADSAARLIAKLAELGFPDYETFQSRAVIAELQARDSALGRDADAELERLSSMLVALDDIGRETRELLSVFATTRGLPQNLRILAGRLEASGGPITVIATNYATLSNEIDSWLHQFLTDEGNAFAGIGSAVEEAVLLRCIARVQSEASDQFRGEAASGTTGPVDVASEQARLDDQRRSYVARAEISLRSLRLETRSFAEAVRGLRRQILGLGSTRVMCKIESARLPERVAALGDIAEKLDQVQLALEKHLERIDTQTEAIRAQALLIGTAPQAAAPGSPSYGGSIERAI